MNRRVNVWPAAGGPAETFYAIDRIVLIDGPGASLTMTDGQKLLLLNPMHLLACVVETDHAAAAQESPR